MDGWRHKKSLQVLDGAVITTLRKTQMETQTLGVANSWLLTEVSTCPGPRLFIGHFMRDRRDAAKFEAPRDEQQGKESCACQ